MARVVAPEARTSPLTTTVEIDRDLVVAQAQKTVQI